MRAMPMSNRVNGGKALSEYIFSGMPQIADGRERRLYQDCLRTFGC